MWEFNEQFYVACATVIPVLFLALALQGRTYESVMGATYRQLRTPVSSKWMRRLGWGAVFGLNFLGLIIIGSGGVGEGLALWGLYKGSDTPGERRVLLAMTLTLLIVVTLSPVVAFVLSLRQQAKDEAANDQRAVTPRGTGSNGGQLSAG